MHGGPNNGTVRDTVFGVRTGAVNFNEALVGLIVSIVGAGQVFLV